MTMLGAVWNRTTDDFVVLNPEALDAFIGVTIDDGADLDTVSEEIEALADQYPSVSVQERVEFIGALAGQVTGLLNVVYGLPALSVVIALLGLCHTLSLVIHVRTGELGALRPLGMTDRSERAAFRG